MTPGVWSERDAADTVASYAERGVSEDIALRVYSARLLGRDPLLVLHGGGNSSVKTSAIDVFGDRVEVLAVKGSGWDMGDIEPPGFPLVRLAPLLRLRELDKLSDEDMVNALRANLLDQAAPNPSVETLLHAFLPHKFIDHTHSTAILSLVNQPNGEELAREVFGERMAYVPYIMPGFALSKAAASFFEACPDAEGLILLKHGIFSFGPDARTSYERMIGAAALAETRLAQAANRTFAQIKTPPNLARAADVAPVIRGACAIRSIGDESKHLVATFRSSAAILAYVNGEHLGDYSQRGVVTPDHVIRTKNTPLVAPLPVAGRLEDFAQGLSEGVADFAKRYDEDFSRENARAGGVKTKLDPFPRVVLVPGLGLFGLGASHKDAAIAADLAENTIRVVTGAEAIGHYEALPAADIFDMEYWSLEQAKLGKAAEKPLARQIAVVTGGAGAIGRATAKALKAEGADVVVLDIDAEQTADAAKALGVTGFACDVTRRESIRAAFDRICETFGGVDIIVSNAGAAWRGKIGDVDEAALRASFDLNFFAHQAVAQEAVRIMLAQGMGGALLFNVSKQAIDPGPDFGPYGLPKAATMFLVRQYAVDYGKAGIRTGGVNADRIRSGLLTDGLIAERATARGLTEEAYMAGNLLGREVTGDDVAQAFVALAKARATTGHVFTVDGGNMAAALR